MRPHDARCASIRWLPSAMSDLRAPFPRWVFNVTAGSPHFCAFRPLPRPNELTYYIVSSLVVFNTEHSDIMIDACLDLP
jgi:hypothetical protein